MQRKEKLYLALAAIGTAVLCHLCFSPYGFNPTDEGFVLSSSMRLLHGQIPHVGFSSLRPLGYAYLHIPELLIDKDHTFLVSRFVYWLEMSGIAYVWVLMIAESSNFDVRTSNFKAGVFLFFITFLFNAHYFPIAVLHTIDGLLFALTGFYILLRKESYGWLGGLFIGYAVLCKQGYAVMIPVLMASFPKQRTVWISALVPGFIYVLYVAAMGGWNDLRIQLGAHTELLEVGILNYISNPWLFGGIILNFGSRKLRVPSFIMLAGLMAFMIALLVSRHYHGQGLLLLFGYALSESFFDPGRRRLYFLALSMAWCASVSVGYASIALFSGGILSLLLLHLAENGKPISRLMIPAMLLACAAAFIYSRTTNIYREAARSKLTYSLDGLATGAKGIYTNHRTFAVLNELDSLQHVHPGILILPDFTACQLFDHDRPVLTEWPNRAEVPNEQVLQKVVSPIGIDTAQRIAIARHETAQLYDTLIAADHDQYRVIRYVSSHYLASDSSRYFMIYRHK